MRTAPVSRYRAATTSRTCSACTPKGTRFRFLRPSTPRIHRRRRPHLRRPRDLRHRPRLGLRARRCRRCTTERLRAGSYRLRRAASNSVAVFGHCSSGAGDDSGMLVHGRCRSRRCLMLRKILGLALIATLSFALATVVTVVRRATMAHRALAAVAVLALIFGAFSPVYAASRAGMGGSGGMGGGGGMRGGGMGGGGQWHGGGGGQWHAGGNWHGNFHGNFHGRGCCCCGPRVFVGIGGGFAWGPWWWGSPWAYPWPSPSFAFAPPVTSWAQGPSSNAPAGMQ